MTPRRPTFVRSRGFTLVEMVVVMMIITILAGAIAVQVTNRVQHARRARSYQDIATLSTALDLYAADNGKPPTTQQGLAALRRKPASAPVPTNWSGPYINKNIFTDAWGTDYVYRYPGQENPEGYDLICYGADEQPGGEGELDADITNFDEG